MFGWVDMNEYYNIPPDPQFPFRAPASTKWLDDRRRFRPAPQGEFLWFGTQEEVNAHLIKTFMN